MSDGLRRAFHDQIGCPVCGKMMHQRALQCTNCGFRPDLVNFQELVGSLGTVCSILVGFGLASVVTLATFDTERPRNLMLTLVEGCWIVASVFLLAILLLSEFMRRSEPDGALLVLASEEQDRFGRRAAGLMLAFSFAVLLIFIGLILLALNLALWLGIVTGIAVIITVVMVVLWSRL